MSWRAGALNTEGELGDGTTATRWQYGDVRAGNDVVQVAAGMAYALALRSGGTVWAWGSNGHGELGDGTQAERHTPVQVTGLTGITQVAAGAFFSLALRSDGTVWAWGDNQNGQLGRGTVTDHEATPARVAVLNGVTKISAGHDRGLVRGDRDLGGRGGLARDGERQPLRTHLSVDLGRQRLRGTRRRHAGRSPYPRAGDRDPGVHRGCLGWHR